jgi:TPR repeat protein
VDNGRAELATAQRYLNGTAGQRRDSAEAAKWLWRSIAKHNSEATVALADLYLKGDGVSKNCDQARILLDSAARKGTAGAGERLRNLPAFGCQ